MWMNYVQYIQIIVVRPFLFLLLIFHLLGAKWSNVWLILSSFFNEIQCLNFRSFEAIQFKIGIYSVFPYTFLYKYLNHSFWRVNNTSSIPHLRKAKSNFSLVAPSFSLQLRNIWNVCSRDLFGYWRCINLISFSLNPSLFANGFQSLSPILIVMVIRTSSGTGEHGLNDNNEEWWEKRSWPPTP